ncbi:hypothetical protein OKJ48_33595 [Streptomyces kunmingensis]|uniref:DUF1524 domain-containing protein n=1 Tax=Streptomyces kunmingensis TaxID=68225 RepID=A0ABU6CK73_9ACTN|nr:hypothetical protein [Streptomyces kunmingensis]MEB3965125.1 hypothetical protein [Streptomyces kunmingensis]
MAGLALLLSAAHAGAAPPRDPGQSTTLSVGEALVALPVDQEHRAGYQRSLFKHSTDEDHDGCSTRNEILLEEAVVAPERSGRCTLTGGRWYSPYDDRTIDGPRGLDIDHLVPLAEAYDSK